MRSLRTALLALLLLAGGARADGPPVGPLAPPEASAPDSITAVPESFPPSLASDEPTGHRTVLLRRVLLAGGVCLTGLAIWRDEVADNRAEDYDLAIFSESAARLRDDVRSAEQERNVLAAIAAVSFSVVLASFAF